MAGKRGGEAASRRTTSRRRGGDTADATVDARQAEGQGAAAVIQVHDEYYVLARSSLADDRTRVLKTGETLAIFDRFGDVHPVGQGAQGLYHGGTRFLSRFELRIGDARPILLSSTVREDNALVTVDLTNPELHVDDTAVLAQDSIHLFRSAVLWEGTCHHRLRIRSFQLAGLHLSLALAFEADFKDVFEVRGIRRAARGRLLPPEIDRQRVTLAYEGLDGRVRRTVLEFDPVPCRLDASEAGFDVVLPPGGQAVDLRVNLACALESRSVAQPRTYEDARTAVEERLAERAGDWCRVWTSNEWFNDWLNRSGADLRMMTTDTRQGPYPFAGIPWFDAPFGRDGIVTGLETLWVNPRMAEGVLRYLAAFQAAAEDAASDAEPGKILHETRGGEMAELGEVPFRRYYGSVDATPLFLVLLRAYYERTGDRALVEELWPHALRALEWMEHASAPDGFLRYARRAATGLANQGWKDSADAVMHADGTLAEPPIALCEVQAYAYGALRGAAELATMLGEDQRGRLLESRAQRLREAFAARFWSEELGTFVLALDAAKRPCRVRASNAGQCLLTGLAHREHAQRVAGTLMADDLFSGWGLRTLAREAVRYNPMSYHNGSVWPHDNALIAAGLARYDLKDPVLRIMTGLFEAVVFTEFHRMPELFCGFGRRPGEAPTFYPVACSPQAWAAGAVYLLLEACLGLRVSGAERRVLFSKPILPPFLSQVHIERLLVADAELDLLLHRHGDDVGIEVRRREGQVDIAIEK